MVEDEGDGPHPKAGVITYWIYKVMQTGSDGSGPTLRDMMAIGARTADGERFKA